MNYYFFNSIPVKIQFWTNNVPNYMTIVRIKGLIETMRKKNDAADFDRRSYKLEPRWSRPNCLCLLTIFHRPTGRVPRVIITLVNHSSLNQIFDIFSANTKYLRIYFLLLWQPLYLLFYKESVTRCTVYGMLSSELYICCLATMILTSSSSYKNALQR